MSEKQDDTMTAIIMLGDVNLPDDNTLAKTITARLPDVPFASGSWGDCNSPSLFIERGAMCAIMRIDKPAPVSSRDPAFAFAWYWPNAWETVKKHKAHMVIAVSGGQDARTRAVILGQLIAAAIEAAPSSLAVHCATPDVLLPATAVPKMVAPLSDAIVIPLVVAAKLSRDTANSERQPPKLSAVTRGLSAFGVMEVEALGFSGKPDAFNATVLDIASYLITAGPVIKDGDTVGPNAKTKMIVRHEASRFLPDQKVYRLYFEGESANVAK